MKLLFTGASGFLGYNIRPLLEKQYDVVHTIGLTDDDDIKINMAKEVLPYGCEYGELIDENHPLDGDSPYAKSKIMAEEYLTKWCLDHQVRLGILRPSLLAGKNAPGNLGAMVNGVKKGFYR